VHFGINKKERNRTHCLCTVFFVWGGDIMKVLHVISDENIGGAGILLLNLLEHFDPSRIESRVALPRGSALIPRLEALGIACIPLAHNCDRFTPASVRELLQLIRT
jgi:hypothetical protein